MKLRTRTWFERLKRPVIGFIKFRLLHIDDTPVRIARGAAIGFWVAFTPLMGFHMIIALTLATVFRANKALAVALVWLSNPFTVLPVYGPCYLIGRFLVGWLHPSVKPVDTQQIGDLLNNVFSFSKMVTCLHSKVFWKELAVVFGKIGLEVSIGGFVIGTVMAVAGYFFTLWFVTSYRQKKGRRRFRHHV